MVASAWRNRSLIRALVKREVLGRYRGSALGILWSFFNLVFMLSVYTFVFSVVFVVHMVGKHAGTVGANAWHCVTADGNRDREKCCRPGPVPRGGGQ